MTYFPQPNSANPAKRVKLVSSVAVAIRSEDTQPVRAKLQDLSATGGLLILSKALDQVDFVELAFSTSQGMVHGMAELLPPRCESASGCLQPFRFIAMGDEDHTRLRMALESLLDRTMVAVPSSKSPSL